MKKTKHITTVLSFLFVILAVAVKLFEDKTKYNFLIGTLNGDGLIYVFLICACICLVISAITAFVSKREKHIAINTIIRIILLAGIVYHASVLSFLSIDSEYYTFTSPDEKYSIIVEEWSFLLGGGVNFYERKNSFLVVGKESFSTDDGYGVISAGNYSVEWNENIMTFTGNNGNGVFETVKIELSN